MARVVALAVLLAVTPACLRIQYDRCEESPPHPDCLDAGPDAGDAGADAAEVDSGTDGGPGDAGDHDGGSPDGG